MELFKKHEKDIDKIDELPPSDAQHLTSTFGKPENFLPDNGKFEAGENDPSTSNMAMEEEKAEGKLVAIKKFKLNAFCEREGIPFNALREIKLL